MRLAYALVLAVALSGCLLKDNPNHCTTDCPADAPIDTPPPMCTVPEDCDRASATPFCNLETNRCVGCTDSPQCAGLMDGRNVCLRVPPATYGECVVCDEDNRQAEQVGTASDECQTVGMQVCDGGTHLCRACAADAECTSGICNAGICVAAADIAYVGPGGTGTSPCASRTTPCPTVAIGASAGRPFVLVAPGSYTELAVTDINNRDMTIRATGATMTRGGQLLNVRGSSDVVVLGGIWDCGNLAATCVGHSGDSLVLQGVTVRNALMDGINATAPTVIRDSTIRGHDRVGIVMNDSGSDFELVRSTVLLNGSHGVQVTARAAVIVNNFILKNGAGMTANGLRLDAIGMLGASRIEFNTIAENLANSSTTGGGVNCGATDMQIRNSIIWGNNGATEVDDCLVRFSTVEGATPDTTNGILNVAPSFIDPASDNFGLMPGSPVAGQADPNANLNLPANTDHAGDPRPMPASTRADLGADEIP